MSDPAVDLLHRHWGHDQFRAGQELLVRAVLEGRDVLGVLPTGGGKSLCYQLPALLLPGLTVVVSPLIALMEDQVSGLRARGIEATFLNSGLSSREVDRRWNAVFADQYRLLYVAPERLSGERFRARITQVSVSRLIVDEAHCISAWGHDFRPAYRALKEARDWMGNPPTAAFTATATPPVRTDIEEMLGLRNPVIHVGGFDRPEITWSVFQDPDKPARVADVLRGVQGAGVVYSATRAGVDRWADRIRQAGVSVSRYHAGMPARERTAQQQDWMEARTRVMVATSAFGMGIDRGDVRFVIHLDLPPSLDAFYQEAGRAGRDRAPAHAVLLVAPDDPDALRNRLDQWHPRVADVREVYVTACSMAGIAIGSEADRPFAIDMEAVGRVTGLPPGRVRGAVELMVQQGMLSTVRPREGMGRLRLRATGSGVEGSGSTPEPLRAFIETVVRYASPESAEGWDFLHVPSLARRAGLSVARAEAGLAFLALRGLIDWLPPDQSILYQMPGPRPGRPPVDAAAARGSRRRTKALAEDMIRYAGARGCRRRWLLGYFGQSSPDRCGRCDDCLGRHEPFVLTPEHEQSALSILRAVQAGMDPGGAPQVAALPAYRRQALVDALLAEGDLERSDPFAPIRITPRGAARLNGGLDSAD